MARLARIVIPGLPHHVTQRGNRREAIFFQDGDHEIYRDLLAEQTLKAGVEVWTYCLMPNHVHLILMPRATDALGRAVGETHRRYTNFINARGRWTGHLFQSRIASVPMGYTHLMRAVRYVSLNPFRANFVARVQDWKWSSVKAHLACVNDELVNVRPVLDRIANFADLLREDLEEDFTELRQSEGSEVLWMIRTSSPDWSDCWGERSLGVLQVANPHPAKPVNNLIYSEWGIGIKSPYLSYHERSASGKASCS